ncbi:hypothetical protein DY000_02029547 [Brassica cretica]|uniref:Uncharacterized protein n=1 Tax=Brassica cretica TaxID=69181 RepID=A0ABQ7DZI5_BRACR|nr:hypothetical protein DY000_02029547 [Brassica cretica]
MRPPIATQHVEVVSRRLLKGCLVSFDIEVEALLVVRLRGMTGTWPAVPEATRKLNFYSQQILQVWNVRSSSTDNNTSSSIDSRQPPSTSTPISSTDTRFPPSTEDTLPSTDIFHPRSIDTSVRIPIDTEPRDMVATLILVHDEKGDLHDQEGHLRNVTDDDFWQVVKQEKLQEGDFEVESLMSFGGSHWCRSTLNSEHRSTDVTRNQPTSSPEHRSTTPTESTRS